ncbi:MAG TPA: type IV pilus assembly protein PilM [bacterium]|jgi:type IV pilus assembly protein PilM|nr:type IV pilus assembly protein PilM [bacterium]
MPVFGSPLIGLDIGTSSIKLVQLIASGKDRWTLQAFAMQDLSDEAVEEIDADLRASVVGLALKKAFKSSKASGRKVVTAVSGDAVIVRYVKLPFMSPAELKNVISYEAEQHIPLPIDQVILDHHILGTLDEDGQRKLEVLLVAAKTDMVDDRLSLLKAAHLKPSVIDVDSFAMENAYLANYGVEKGETVALVNIGAKTTTINVIEDGVSHLTRDFAVAGNQFTKQMQTEMSLGFPQAEELKRQQGQVAIESDEIMLTSMPDKDDRSMAISEAVTPVLNKMLSEFRRSFDFYENSIKKRPISKVLLSGGGARLKNIEKFFADKLGVATEIADPFRRVDIPKGMDAESIRAAAPALMVGIGLALRKGSAL